MTRPLRDRGTSRNVLGLIRNSGEEPVIIEYIKNPPSRQELVSLIGRMGIPVRDLLRRKGTPSRQNSGGAANHISPPANHAPTAKVTARLNSAAQKSILLEVCHALDCAI
jgi:hypothetical protein